MLTFRTLASATLLAALVLPGAGCGDSHEAITLDTISTLQEYAAVLGSVTDEASAESAEPRVKAIGEKLAAIRRRSQRIGEAPGETQTVLRDKYSRQLQEARLEVRRRYAAIDPRCAELLAEAIENLEMSAW